MNILKTALPPRTVTQAMATTLTVALITTLSLASAAALAGPEPEALSKTVNYAALDLTKTAGAEDLYKRLNSAARLVCAPADGRLLSQKLRYRTCVDTALSNAVVRVDQPLVKNIHDEAKTIRLASK